MRSSPWIAIGDSGVSWRWHVPAFPELIQSDAVALQFSLALRGRTLYTVPLEVSPDIFATLPAAVENADQWITCAVDAFRVVEQNEAMV